MGDRGEVKVIQHSIDAPVYLYTHWGATYLCQTVANALERGRSRWDDPPYLTRIIFSDMIEDEVGETTGYGISTRPGDVWRTVVVDCTLQKIIVQEHTLEYVGSGYEHGTDEKFYTFDDFINEYE